ncbi:branched-chain amino acid ABC transporter permease [Verrucosispora sp. WMMA2121]|uniref:branched-chain amino acid ABC transporter permease n=1 Tax=Verrucosispora sp. WMMA2121 TaxID=3015164 RepID=UPI0022B60E73|nr:branched-chain amino acid ABC transporter permease [Verrucosispora sp. WMMA2121]MCZ7422142.1 branched-chain amino acid ABC transporter permease [Verrucosispora sp. WMMA2121]
MATRTSAAPTWGTDMEQLAEQIVSGIGNGAIYASLAVALVLVFRSTGVINLAQGEMAMFSTFVAWQLTAIGLNIWLAFLITVVLSMAAGAGIERVLIRPFRKRDELTIIIVTLGLFLIFNSLAGWIWSYTIRPFPSLLPDGTLDIGPVRTSIATLGTLAIVLAATFLLFLLFQRSKVGLAMRAVVDNGTSSQLVGIPIGAVLSLGWALAAGMGAMSGILIAPKLFLEPHMMFGVLIYSFAAATLGGWDSPIGAVIAGLLVGVGQNLAATYIPWIGSDLTIVFALATILAVLLVRPAGLLGSKEVARV